MSRVFIKFVKAFVLCGVSLSERIDTKFVKFDSACGLNLDDIVPMVDNNPAKGCVIAEFAFAAILVIILVIFINVCGLTPVCALIIESDVIIFCIFGASWPFIDAICVVADAMICVSWGDDPCFAAIWVSTAATDDVVWAVALGRDAAVEIALATEAVVWAVALGSAAAVEIALATEAVLWGVALGRDAAVVIAFATVAVASGALLATAESVLATVACH